MKISMLHIVLILSPWVVGTAVFAQGMSTAVPPSSTTVVLESFENKNASPLGTKWAFLKDQHGPLPDAVSNGLIRHLSRALQERQQITVTGLGQETRPGTIQRGLPSGTPEETPSSGETPRFVVSCSATMTGDKVTIEVRLIDPQTKRLISATKVEGRPEDLNEEIRGRFAGTAIAAESPAEKAVRAAITKAATWIGENTVDAVVVKASMTKIKEIPSLQGPTLVTVRQGTRLRKVGAEGEWIRVRLDGGEMGWVYSEVIE